MMSININIYCVKDLISIFSTKYFDHDNVLWRISMLVYQGQNSVSEWNMRYICKEIKNKNVQKDGG